MTADPQIIRIVDFVDGNGVIHGEEFRNCLIQGPAVLLPISDVHLTECSVDAFEGTLDAVFVEIPEGPRNGMVGLDNVTFENCSFMNIGLAGTPQSVEEMRLALGEPS